MSIDYSKFEKRKQDHITLALMPENQAHELNTLDSLKLLHEALPDLDFASISIAGTRFGHAITKPLMISSMTAGHIHAELINDNLMAACTASDWAMGVGSQRRELSDSNAATIWHKLRRKYPNISLFGNLGIAQLIETNLVQIQKLTDTLNASALIIHCNPLQECIQPEGTPNFKGCWDALTKLIKTIDLPIIIKETGCGFSTDTLKRLNEIGVTGVDVSGAGGTHWGRIEGHRASNDHIRSQSASTFANWGIDTAQSIRNAHAFKANFEIWGSGGVRNGLDAAKLFALGASTVAFAKSMLAPALESTTAVLNTMNTIEYELKIAMFCTGSQVLSDLRTKLCT